MNEEKKIAMQFKQKLKKNKSVSNPNRNFVQAFAAIAISFKFVPVSTGNIYLILQSSISSVPVCQKYVFIMLNFKTSLFLQQIF